MTNCGRSPARLSRDLQIERGTPRGTHFLTDSVAPECGTCDENESAMMIWYRISV